MATTAKLSNAELQQLEKAHVFHSWSAQGALAPLAVERAEGVYMWDHDGKRYLDFSSQLVNTNIGHQHPKVVAAIKEQADLLCTVAPQHANAKRAELAAMVAELAPGDIDMAFFTNGGAEATENAMRMARIYTGRHKVMATYRSYHGGTGGSLVLTGDPRRWAAEPGMAGVVHFCGPVPLPLVVQRHHRGRGVRARARAPRGDPDVRGRPHGRRHHPRVGGRHERHPGAARRLPAGRPRAVHASTAS